MVYPVSVFGENFGCGAPDLHEADRAGCRQEALDKCGSVQWSRNGSVATFWLPAAWQGIRRIFSENFDVQGPPVPVSLELMILAPVDRRLRCRRQLALRPFWAPDLKLQSVLVTVDRSKITSSISLRRVRRYQVSFDLSADTSGVIPFRVSSNESANYSRFRRELLSSRC